MTLPAIALTMGDPAGVGPELCLKVAAAAEIVRICRPVIVGDRRVLETVADRLGLEVPETTLEGVNRAAIERIERSAVVDLPLAGGAVEPGRPTREGGAGSYAWIEAATRGALEGIFGAICTAPVTKATLKLAGIKEPGHTEILARLTGTANFGMLLYSPRIAVGLVTIHQSLASVPAALTVEEIVRVGILTGETVERIRGRRPRLAVLGLNPHAGEGGLFGNEEARVIAPAVERLRAAGWEVDGPLPPDTAFTPRALGRFDAHVVMYHDQGLIPFKMIAFDDGVNVTMGLPIVRTSPDHGTAYDIAWSGKAEAASMLTAAGLAARMATRRGRRP